MGSKKLIKFLLVFLCMILVVLLTEIKVNSCENREIMRNSTEKVEETVNKSTVLSTDLSTEITKTEISKTTTQSKTTTETTLPYTEDELYILSHTIYGEASGCSYEHKLYVGSVILNRVNSKHYPNSIEDVVFQQGQYACTWDGNYDKTPDKETIEIAEYLLSNGSQIPDNVVYQAEFYQGSGVWKQSGNTYFCYR